MYQENGFILNQGPDLVTKSSWNGLGTNGARGGPATGEGINLNPLHAKFSGGTWNIYLHFMSFLHIDMTQVLKILSQVRPEPTYLT